MDIKGENMNDIKVDVIIPAYETDDIDTSNHCDEYRREILEERDGRKISSHGSASSDEKRV